VSYAWRSTGTMGSAFNANMTPGAPAGFVAGDLLVVRAFCIPGSVTIPDLTSQGFTKFSLNTVTSYAAIYAKIAVGGDTMPTFQYGTDWQGCFCDAYTGGPSTLTGIASQASVERSINTTANIQFNGYTAPPDAGCLILGVGCRNPGSATGVTYGSASPYSVRGTWLTDARPHAICVDLIQTVSASGALVQVTTNPADSVNQAAGSELVFFKPASGAALAGAATVASSATGNFQAASGVATVATSSTAALTTAIQNAGSAFTSTAAVAALTNWATVTLSGSLYTGSGGILDPNFWLDVLPQSGSVIYYDATHITVYPNGEISSNTNNCSAVVQFNDGTAWSMGLVIITPNFVTYAHVLAAAAGAMTTGIVLAGAALTAAQAAGGLTTAIQLAGLALSTVNGAASLTTSLQLNAAALANVSAGGALTGGTASLQGQATVLSQALANLTTQIQAAAQAVVGSQVTGALSAQIMFQGTANALTQASAQLTGAIQFAGNIQIAVTAAGAALTQSAFAGAVNILSTAMGSLLTGLLIAGNALVSTSATGSLTTGITLSGAAVVDVQTALRPVGLEGQFGYATINVLSTTGLPVALATFIQNSTCIVSISYFNAKGLPFVPNQINYRVDDVVSGSNLVPWTPIQMAAVLNAVTITAAQNQMVNNSRSSEEHQILFQITDGVGNVNYESAVYDLIRVTGTH
jgi:hypothetical protein